MSDSEPATTGPDENVGQGEDVTGIREKHQKWINVKVSQFYIMMVDICILIAMKGTVRYIQVSYISSQVMYVCEKVQ